MLELNDTQRELAFIKNLISILPENVYWKDSTGVFLGCNINVAKVFGLTHPNDIIGKTDYDLLSPGLAKLICDIDAAVIARDRVHLLEETGFSGDGLAVYRTTRIPLHDEHKNVIGLLGHSVNITDSKGEIQIDPEIIEDIQNNLQIYPKKFKVFFDRHVRKISQPDEESESADREPQAEPIIDWEFPKQFGLKDEYLEELMQSLYEELPNDVALLKEVQARNNPQEMRAFLHKLEVGFSYLGVPRLQKATSTLHEAIKKNLTEPVLLPLFNQFYEETQNVITALDPKNQKT